MAGETPMVPPLDLRQALYFVTVSRELNFSRAAERLHISTPAVSQQIKALERRLGVQLLVRDTRQVRLTAAGAVFAAACERLLHDGESAVISAREAAGVISGELALAALHEAELAFEPFLSGFHAAHPGIHVTLITCRHAELLSALRNRTADAALTWSFMLDRVGDTEGLRWMDIAPTEVVAALHPANPLAKCDRVPRGELLRAHTTILFERGYSPVTYDYAVEQLYGAGCADPPVHEISVTVRAQETMARQISDNAGFAALSRPVADLVRGRWVIRPFDPPWWMDGSVVWHRDNSSAALIAFMAMTSAAGVQPVDRGSAAPHGGGHAQEMSPDC